MAAHHGRGQVQYIDIAADRQGNVKGLRVRCSPTWAPTCG